MEGDHHVKLKEQTKLIKAEQERAHHKFQDQIKHKKKEVILMTIWGGGKSFLKLVEKSPNVYFCSYFYICFQVKQSVDKLPRSQRKDTLKLKMNEFQEKKLEDVCLLGAGGFLFFYKIIV